MYSPLDNAPFSEEKTRQRSFEMTNQYGSDLAPLISKEDGNNPEENARFETSNYIVLNDLRVFFK
ncbi:MAG: hypothetical protein ABIF85_07065 [Nanoarchaeota archaeon]|nr:hypothetical protein [Nanoarchaeota archaeon]MBU4300538.1 hypothetical protein [Nanoarchaeota archaeon]MBU4451895.1 hypothetical protein [Nanoarchaeota archaeon]MCG2724179.1 hypothetical protein [archaeon]